MNLALLVGALLLLAFLPAMATADPIGNCNDPETGQDGILVNGNCRTFSQHPGEACHDDNQGYDGIYGPLDDRCLPVYGTGVTPCHDTQYGDGYKLTLPTGGGPCVTLGFVLDFIVCNVLDLC
jgi:hypothetical protein